VNDVGEVFCAFVLGLLEQQFNLFLLLGVLALQLQCFGQLEVGLGPGAAEL